MAARRARPARSVAGGPLHHRVLQLPRPGRAAHGAAQRGLGRAAGRRRRTRGFPLAGPADGRQRHRPGCRADAGPGPPRLGQQGATRPHRGRPQVGSAAVRRGHVQPRARHRHGCRRPRGADQHAPVGGQRAAARRPGRAPGRRGLARHPLPHVAARPRRCRRHGRAHARRPHRAARRAGQPARRARPADRGGRRSRAARRRGMVRRRPPQRAVLVRAALGIRCHSRPPGRALPV